MDTRYNITRGGLVEAARRFGIRTSGWWEPDIELESGIGSYSAGYTDPIFGSCYRALNTRFVLLISALIPRKSSNPASRKVTCARVGVLGGENLTGNQRYRFNLNRSRPTWRSSASHAATSNKWSCSTRAGVRHVKAINGTRVQCY